MSPRDVTPVSKTDDDVGAARATTADLCEWLGVPAEASPEELLDLGVIAYNSSGYQMARAGLCFKLLKEAVEHGNRKTISDLESGYEAKTISGLERGYEAALQARGVEPRHANNGVRLLDYIASLPRAEARRMLKVPYTKALACSKADPEVVEALLEEGALDGKQPLTVRELRARLAEVDQGRIDAVEQSKAMQQQLETLTAPRADKLDSAFASLRDQAAFLCCKMFEESAILARLAADKLIVKDWRGSAHAEDRQAVATTFYHTLNGVAANIAQLLEDLSDSFGTYVTAGVHPAFKYPPKLRERLQALREEALSAAEKEFHDAQIDARVKHKVRGRHR